MNKNHHIDVNFKNAEAKVKAKITLISFKELDDFIIYSPHLEVSGYGKTYEAAMDSFNHSLGIFLDYTTNKKTLHKELIRLGWLLKKGSVKQPKKINAPSMTDLAMHNEQLKDLLNKHDISTFQKEVIIPV